MRDAVQLSIRDARGGAVLAVKVVPGASRDGVAGVLGDCLKVTTSVPAERGRANAAVCRTLANALGVQRRAVTLVAGQTNPRKQFQVAGLSAETVRMLLGEL